MAFKVIRGACVKNWFPKTASVTLSANFLVDFNATGTLTSATVSATNIAGVVMVSVASTDTDFADVTSLMCETPIPDSTILEADVSGTDFNLACILLGLERDGSLEPYFQFSDKPVKGPRVEIEILKTTADGKVAIKAAEALFDSGAKDVEQVAWVYTGSQKHWRDDRFAADVTGTLIGFVHDPNTIIESVMGLGIGAYGSIQGNAALLPAVGSDVELIVTVPASKAEKK